jgi:hypothetical protein
VIVGRSVVVGTSARVIAGVGEVFEVGVWEFVVALRISSIQGDIS